MYAHLERAARPERPAKYVIQCPREARLLPPVLFAPLLLPLCPSPTKARACQEPLRARPSAWLDLTGRKARVPLVCLLDAPRPCRIELRPKVAGLARLIHLPQVRRLQCALVAERLKCISLRKANSECF